MRAHGMPRRRRRWRPENRSARCAPPIRWKTIKTKGLQNGQCADSFGYVNAFQNGIGDSERRVAGSCGPAGVKEVGRRAGWVWLTWSGIADNPGKRERGRVETPHTPIIYIPDN